MRGYLVVKENKKKEYLEIFFNAYWRDNIDLSIEENIIQLVENLNINRKEFFIDIAQKKIKDKLKFLTDQVFKKEIFGAPTFAVNNKIFWGQDRLEYALDEFKNI